MKKKNKKKQERIVTNKGKQYHDEYYLPLEEKFRNGLTKFFGIKEELKSMYSKSESEKREKDPKKNILLFKINFRTY